MNFEEALCAELQAIAGLENRVYPQNATEGTEPPFVLYMSSEGEKIRTLEGFTNLTELTCEIHVITNSYEQLKGYQKAVLNKIQSFYSRTIGTNGPFIKSVSYVEPTEDFDETLNYHQSVVNVSVRY